MSVSFIEVTFLHADTGHELGRDSMPASVLPDRLSASRRIELRGVAYAVVHAEPATRAGAHGRGRATISLRPLPDGFYSVPTLAEELPRMEEQAQRDGRLLEIDGDDWEQIEFYSTPAGPRVFEQLERIGRVRGEANANGFFPRMHIRGQHGPLLKGVEMTVGAVAQTLPPGTLRLDGIVIEGQPGVVKDAFAFLTPGGFEVYGVAPKGRVRVLAARQAPVPAPETPVIALGLSVLMLEHGLSLVDWVRMRTAEATAAAVEALFASP